MLITFRTLNHVFYINSEDTIHFSNTVTKTVNLSILGGKVPDFLAKMVHFSLVARMGTGSTGLSGRTWHFHPRGKCRIFPRKWFTFPRGRMGHRLHRPLSQHLPFPPSGKVPGFSAKTVHFPPWPTRVLAPQASLAALAVSTSGESAGFFGENDALSPVW